MELRQHVSDLSLFSPAIFTRRAEFRYSTYNSEKKKNPFGSSLYRDEMSPKKVFKKYARHSQTSPPKGESPNVLTPQQRLSNQSTKPIVNFNSKRLFRKLSKEYYLNAKDRLVSFVGKTWDIVPSDLKLNDKQKLHAEQEKKETKSMMKALLEILEDYNNEISGRDKNHSECVSNPNQSYKSQAPHMPPFVVPKEILGKYEDLELPRSKQQQQKLLRPLIYLDVRRKGCSRVHTIVIELYTEACPAVVLEFVRRCSQNDCQLFSFQRSFPALWIEAGLRLDSKKLQNGEIEYDMRALHHGSAAGILSFPARYVNGFCRNNLEFTISVDPLPEMQNARVAFGVVLAGLNFLDDMQVYDMKNCDRINDYRVVRCGLVKR